MAEPRKSLVASVRLRPAHRRWLEHEAAAQDMTLSGLLQKMIREQVPTEEEDEDA